MNSVKDGRNMPLEIGCHDRDGDDGHKGHQCRRRFKERGARNKKGRTPSVSHHQAKGANLHELAIPK